MKILITGGLGFIGLNLIDRLQSKTDYEIVILDNESGGTKQDVLPDNVTFFHGDVGNMKHCHKALQGCNSIIHLATQTNPIKVSVTSPIEDLRINLFGTVNLLELCELHNIENFIFTSSLAVMGDAPVPYHESSCTYPISPHGISKLACEHYLRIYSLMKNLRTIALRFCNIYGNHSSKQLSVITEFVKKIQQNAPLIVYGDGKQTRDFLHVDDLSDLIIFLLTKDPPRPYSHELFCVGSGQQISINELIFVLKEICKSREISVLYSQERPGDIKHSYCSINKARMLLGWKPKISLQEGLERMLKDIDI